MKTARLIYPHQLFLDHLEASKDTVFILVEDDLFFRQYTFHKQKLVLHRASMKSFEARLTEAGYETVYIESDPARKSLLNLEAELKRLGVGRISYHELTDDWLEQKVTALAKSLKLETAELQTPNFITPMDVADEFFNKNANRMQGFYEFQRKRLNILLDKKGKPVGGRWSFDSDNRKKLPKGQSVPDMLKADRNKYIDDALHWVEATFPDNYGKAASFLWPVDHESAKAWLDAFLKERFDNFGPYEDAIAKDQSFLFHSCLSPLINIGLLDPKAVVDEALHYADEHDTPIASVEGFVRQIIGWREYMRAQYIREGRKMRTHNKLGHDRKLPKEWWSGKTGLLPIDIVVQRVGKTAYAHHIERLMILGNAMLLLRYHPDDVYKWFMEMFIDAYDWVMVPNVYAMSQFAHGEALTTKPYVSGSSYIKKMSDFENGDWTDAWDALYWRFVSDNRQVFERNHRSKMMVSLYDKFDADKKRHTTKLSDEWLKKL